MEIDRLSASVDADTRGAERAFDRLDRKMDEAAEDRVAVIKITTKTDRDSDSMMAALGWGTSRAGRPKNNRINASQILGIGGEGLDSLTDGLKLATNAMGTLAEGAGAAGGAITSMGGSAASAATGGLDVMTEAAGGAGKASTALAVGAGTAGASIAMTAAQIVIMIPLIIAAGVAILALAGYVAGLVAALAPLVGVLFALPALIAPVIGAFGILMVVMKDLMPAISEAWQASDKQKENSLALADAEYRLAAAERQRTKALKTMAEARREAAEAIEDAQFAATSAQLSEQRAIIALERAYKRLSDVQAEIAGKTEEITKVTDDFTGKQFEVARITYGAADSQADLRDSLLAVREAELGLAMARDGREDTERRLRELEAKGIEQSDIVTDAYWNLADATRAVEDATRGQAEALAALNGKGEAYDKLGESGQSLVDKILELKPLLEGFTDAMMDAIGPGLETAIDNITPLVENLGTILTPLAEAFGTIAADVTAVWGSDEFGSGLTKFFEDNKDVFQTMGQAIGLFSMAMVNLMNAAKPVTDKLAEELLGAGENMMEWTEGNSSMGDLTSWFELTADVLGKVFDIMGNLIGAFAGFVEAGTPFGTWVLDGIVAASEAMDTFFNSAEGQEQVASFFERIKEPLEAMNELFGTTLKEVIDVFGSQEAMDFLTNFTNMMSEDLVPAIGALADALIKSGFLDLMVTGFGALFSLIVALEPIMTPLLTLMMFVNQPLLTLISFFQNGPPEWLSKFWDPLKTGFIDIINFIIDKWNGLEFQLPSYGGLKVAGKQIIPGWEGPTLGTPKMDYLGGGSVNYGGGTSSGGSSSGTGGWGDIFGDITDITTSINEAIIAAGGQTAASGPVVNQTFNERVDANEVGAATAWAINPRVGSPRNNEGLIGSGPR